MPRNVEIKARLRDRQKAVCQAQALSGSEGNVLHQEDTFFHTHHGRLKLRELEGQSSAMLISYQRKDCSGPKLSTFSIANTETPDDLKCVLIQALGRLGCVKKTRLLFQVGQTRVHIDTVENLGEFLELEVELKSGQSEAEGEEVARDLMDQLGVTSSDLISGAYMDLLLKQNT